METNFNSLSNFIVQPLSTTTGGGTGVTAVLTFDHVANLNYVQSANEILDLLDSMSFSTETPVDPDELRSLIASIICKNVQGNANFNKVQ